MSSQCDASNVLVLVSERNALRQRGEYAAADALRERLRAMGLTVDDRSGTIRDASSPRCEPAPFPPYKQTWHTCMVSAQYCSLEGYLARSAAWPHVPKLQTYRELLGKRTGERLALADHFGQQLSVLVEQRGQLGTILCVEKPYLDGFIRGFAQSTGSHDAPFVLLAINGGDLPLTTETQERLLSLGGLRACYANNMYTAATAATAERIHPLPVGVSPIGVGLAGEALVRETRARAAPWPQRDKRLLVTAMTLNSRSREAYLEVLSRPSFAHLVRICAARLPTREFLRLLAEHQSVLSPPGRGYDCFRTWQALAVGTTPLLPRLAAYDARLFDMGPVCLPQPEALTPQVLASLLDSLAQADSRAVSMQYWAERWQADLAPVPSVDVTCDEC